MFEAWGSWLQAFLQNCIDGLGSALQALLDLLPGSPFEALSNTDVQGYLAWLNWLVPLNNMVAVMELWTSAILIYYLYVIILRWIRAIQ
jgi:hypothetical protein